MSDIEYIKDSMRRYGTILARDLQQKAVNMTGTELNAESDVIPDFKAACEHMNMLKRKAGFVCRSSEGRVVKLLQPYDSTIYPGEPETLPAQWGFVWSQDPAHAMPFVALSTSTYGKGDCCTMNGKIWRSKIKSNVHSPKDYPQGWEEV